MTVVLSLTTGGLTLADDTEKSLLLKLAQGDHVALMRHAIAPGTGDPDHFDVSQCETQRNLDESGRQQARKTGDFFRANGLDAMAIYSSQWCRCLETAKLLDVGKVQELNALNSFYATMHQREESTRLLEQWLQSQSLDQPTLLVTHQVNITAFTGVYPGSGEIVILQRDDKGQFKVAGTINPR